MSPSCVLLLVLSIVSTTFCATDSFVYKDEPSFTPGSPCKTSEGLQGTCTIVQRCRFAFVNRQIKPKVCGFQGEDVFVCCENLSSNNAVNQGKKCFQGSTRIIKRLVHGVIGGVRTASSEFPHMVALGYGNADDIKWKCGGSLISENYVLTAAHCLYSRTDGDVKYIRAGTTRLTNPERSVQDFGVGLALPHPEYQAPVGYNDIALIKLNAPIRNTKSVKPACLSTNFSIDGGLLAMGWGHLYNGGDPSNDLMKVNLVEYSHKVCSGTFSKDTWTIPNGIQKDRMICAGGKQNEERDTCQGDSGGPLQLNTFDHIIVGITSFGKVCGTPNIPGVYTRVSKYIDWIEKVVSS